MGDGDSSLLRRRQLLDEAVGGALARLRRRTLVRCLHRLHHEVLIIAITASFEVHLFELLLQGSLLHVWPAVLAGLARLDGVGSGLAKSVLVAAAPLRHALHQVAALVA